MIILIILVGHLKNPEIAVDSISIWYGNLQNHIIYLISFITTYMQQITIAILLATIMPLQYEFERMGTDDSPWIQWCCKVCCIVLILPHDSLVELNKII